MKNFKRPTMLMILDGYGINKSEQGNSMTLAKKPNIDKIFKTYPYTTVKACGLAVGLPEGQMGNSEVGHLNIGAGRVVYQELTRITKEIEDGDFFKNDSISKSMEHVLKNNGALHLMGLLSDGGVHSHINHLKALIKMGKEKKIENIYIHALLDGRDVPPRCAGEYIEELEKYMSEIGVGKIATISGRYYGMDRDQRWERVEKYYEAVTEKKGLKYATAGEALAEAYKRDENDEFVVPSVIDGGKEIADGDAVIMFNFRPDRAREISRVFVAKDFDGFSRKKVVQNLCYVCMTRYDEALEGVLVAYPPQSLDNTFGEYLANEKLTQLRIAETEKYAHVTFFFNGGVEAPNRDEERILIPSPKVATYDLQPEMSAYEVTERVIKEIEKDVFDVIILNYANADMVGHTGMIDAAVKAIETLDECVEKVKEAVLKIGGQILLTADHGNADCMLDEEGNVVTAHSLNDVPLVHISDEPVKLQGDGALCDIVPTLLDLMELKQPKEMTGKSLCKR